MEEKVFEINDQLQKQRLDVFLESTLGNFSRSHYKKSIENGEVLVNGKKVKAGHFLKLGDKVTVSVQPPKQLNLAAQDIALDIIYEDNDLAVINKPQGMVVHPAAGNFEGTLVNALLFNIKNLSGINGVVRPGIVHRLDKDTSGLIIVAKNDRAHVSLSRQIQTKECKRFYMALVHGKLKNQSGVVTSYISRDKKNRLKMAVNFNQEGKFAETHYKVVKEFDKFSLCEFELKTGRTHQIRVHATYLGHSVVGDKLYGNVPDKFHLKGQLLHAYKLLFRQPSTNEHLEFRVPLPEYFLNVINSFQQN